MTNTIQYILRIFLISLVFFSWGLIAGLYDLFPAKPVRSIKAEISAFVAGDENEDTSLTQKLLNDLGLSPERMIRQFDPELRSEFREVAVNDLKERRDSPRLRMTSRAPEHYRMLVGAFDFEDAFWGAVLVGPTGEIVHTWPLSGEISELTDVPDTMKNAYGFGVFPDGSIAYNLQEVGGGLVKRSFCGAVDWIKPGVFHHSAEPTEDYTALWTFGGNQGDLHPVLVLIDAETGETLREIDMADVDRANPGIAIFDLQHSSKGTKHATHPNDVEPLTETYASAFEMFEAGDLVLNYQATNLVFVLDPDSLEVKWWNIGAVDGGHDPDWRPDGTIVVFDNGYRAGRRGIPEYSRIVSLDPARNTFDVLVDGASHDFYSPFNGRQDVSESGTVLITSSVQGRIFEVDVSTGEIVFDFVNAYDWESGRTLHVSEAFFIDGDMVDGWLNTKC